MNKEPDQEEQTRIEELFKAMIKADQAFHSYLSDQGIDSGYFSLYLTGYLLSSDCFRKLQEISMTPSNWVDNESFKFPDKPLETEE